MVRGWEKTRPDIREKWEESNKIGKVVHFLGYPNLCPRTREEEQIGREMTTHTPLPPACCVLPRTAYSFYLRILRYVAFSLT